MEKTEKTGDGPQRKSVRIWQTVDVQEVRRQLILIDDLYGTCANCKQLGLNYLKDAVCPGCKARFRYVASHLKAPDAVAKILKRIEAEGLPLQLIDREDFERAGAHDALNNLFSN